jgi:alpha-ketoglutaric semialdehyde dehydrogenase
VTGAVHVPGHLIDGQWTGPGDDLVATNPAHPDEEVSRAPAGDDSTVEAAVVAARTAQPDWAATPAPARGALLHAAADRLASDAELARLIVREQGKTLAEATGELSRTVATLRYHAERARAPEGETYAAATLGESVHTVRVPVGVVAVITPWNFPLAIPVWKLAPALVHGNTVVWKPAEQTPAVAAHLAEILTAAGLPAGVLNMVLGDARAGACVVDSDVDAITFTGSVPVGRQLLARAAPRGVRVQCELGGHNPAVVLDDANLDRAAEDIVAGAMGSAGQKCTATRRVLVDASVHDALLERLMARCETLVVGDGLDPASDLGPLIAATARDDVLAAIAEAVQVGGDVVTGGSAPSDPKLDGGHYIAPTIVSLPAEPEQLPRLWREEVFGPVTVVRAVSGPGEAFALANDTAYGLSASVHTASLARARHAVSILRAGMISVNGPTTGAELHAPFGGLKDSTAPAPREQGTAVRDFVTTTKTVSVRDPEG